ncbi:glutamine--tRNA ligase [Blochmannia endosymbiont of Camponotus sp.]|uniref:glutamine--tRNA ligase n=1 Tax=Blochmannia endosymbiont of Camponotus sp. TaxID=700220 RepID=UPI002024272F|nr:glutamine--tRNA ligase [Blochmannia endosymbiont of Camponotus sp.]URJ23660.1 glutamine--tRNA ligase [Blochmannia endosymbiont of Camponotus sp.]URJ25581.1 glutamine--tRNA ligase [Blochmannia endosymbiont of Camponotus sp.]
MKILMNHRPNFINHIIDKDLKSKKYTDVRTRFPPEPNGYLHIGHAKAICLNFGVAQYYHGQCNLRIDDTNPEKEHKEYVEGIKHDIQWLGFMWHGDVHYSSDYSEELYDYAIKLIKKGLAYVDELSIDEIKKYRGTLTRSGKNSPYRSRSIKENLIYFSKMRNGGFIEGEACLRAKINMASSSMVMRDPVLYRIKYTPHHRIGKNWCIYPTYDFSHCISDAIEGITHSLCTLEFQENRILYNWILNNIDINTHPTQYEFSRLNLKYIITSKRKLSILVTKNIVDGWDDPRMPTISGLRRRGYTARSIREFCHRIGISKQESQIELSLLESCIRADLNKHAPRLMAVINPMKIVINNLPVGYEERIEMPNHPNNADMGVRHVIFSQEIFIDRFDFCEILNNNKCYKLTLGQEIRLRYAYVIKAEGIKKDKNGNIICIYCSYDPFTLHKNPMDGRKITGVIHWVSATRNISAEFRLYDKLFTHPNPAVTRNLLANINPNSLIISQGVVEENIIHSYSSGPYQIERAGYFILDHHYSKKSYLVFNRTVTLKESKNY